MSVQIKLCSKTLTFSFFKPTLNSKLVMTIFNGPLTQRPFAPEVSKSVANLFVGERSVFSGERPGYEPVYDHPSGIRFLVNYRLFDSRTG